AREAGELVGIDRIAKARERGPDEQRLLLPVLAQEPRRSHRAEEHRRLSSIMERVKAGILPRVLHEQVRSTAGWLWEDPAAADLVGVLDDVEAAEREREAAGVAYSRLLFAAHFATVATFVPTDVDARI